MEPEIVRDWCKGCGICVEFCPKKALGLDRERKVHVEKAGICTGCRLCEIRCPDFAISMPGGESHGRDQ